MVLKPKWVVAFILFEFFNYYMCKLISPTVINRFQFSPTSLLQYNSSGNQDTSFYFSLKSRRQSDRFKCFEISQINADIALRTNVTLNYVKI